MRCDRSALEAVLADPALRDDIRRVLERLPVAEGPIDSIDRRMARQSVAVGEEGVILRLRELARERAQRIADEDRAIALANGALTPALSLRRGRSGVSA